MSKQRKSKSAAFGYIQELKDFYVNDPASIRLLDDKEEELRNLIDAAGIKEQPAILTVVKQAKEIVEGINTVLQNQRDLTEKERAQLIGEKDAHEFYLDRFDIEDADTKRLSIEKYLKEKVEKIRQK